MKTEKMIHDLHMLDQNIANQIQYLDDFECYDEF